MSSRSLTLAKLIALAVHQGDLDEVRRLQGKATEPLPIVSYDDKKGFTSKGRSV